MADSASSLYAMDPATTLYTFFLWVSHLYQALSFFSCLCQVAPLSFFTSVFLHFDFDSIYPFFIFISFYSLSFHFIIHIWTKLFKLFNHSALGILFTCELRLPAVFLRDLHLILFTFFFLILLSWFFFFTLLPHLTHSLELSFHSFTLLLHLASFLLYPPQLSRVSLSPHHFPQLVCPDYLSLLYLYLPLSSPLPISISSFGWICYYNHPPLHHRTYFCLLVFCLFVGCSLVSPIHFIWGRLSLHPFSSGPVSRVSFSRVSFRILFLGFTSFLFCLISCFRIHGSGCVYLVYVLSCFGAFFRPVSFTLISPLSFCLPPHLVAQLHLSSSSHSSHPASPSALRPLFDPLHSSSALPPFTKFSVASFLCLPHLLAAYLQRTPFSGQCCSLI